MDLLDAKEEPVDIQKRDGETYFAIGLYIFVIGIPVVFGTFFSLSNIHAAVVNFCAGVTLVGGGCIGMFYGQLLKRRSAAKK